MSAYDAAINVRERFDLGLADITAVEEGVAWTLYRERQQPSLETLRRDAEHAKLLVERAEDAVRWYRESQPASADRLAIAIEAATSRWPELTPRDIEAITSAVRKAVRA